MSLYYYKENNGKFDDHLNHLVMKKGQSKPIASHNLKETTEQHIDKNNKCFPYGIGDEVQKNIRKEFKEKYG